MILFPNKILRMCTERHYGIHKKPISIEYTVKGWYYFLSPSKLIKSKSHITIAQTELWEINYYDYAI